MAELRRHRVKCGRRWLATWAVALAVLTCRELSAREQTAAASGGNAAAGAPQNLMTKLLQDAKSAAANKQYRTAWRLAQTVSGARGPGSDGFHDQAEAFLRELGKVADDLYDSAEKHWWYREYAEAEAKYRELFDQFPFSTRFADARNRLIALRFMPAVASKKLLEAATGKEAAAAYVEAAKRYEEVIAQYPETVAAIKAKKALISLQSDPAKKQALSGEVQAALVRELDLKLRLACNYIANPPQDDSDWVLYDRGVAHLHEIIALAPDSAQAGKARERIKKEEARIAAEEKAQEEARKKTQAEKAEAEEKARQR